VPRSTYPGKWRGSPRSCWPRSASGAVPRAHALPALYPAAAAGLPALADPGYEGAAIGILIPVKQPPGGRELDVNTRAATPSSVPCAASGNEGRAAHRPVRTLHHITASPSKIGDIARAAFVLTHFEHGCIT
jgi:hypothetical protein